ncbi:MAG: maleylacetoacetate isomerase [Pseudomonadota bacterium]
MSLQLYSYWESSTAYRARIALNLKGLAYEISGVDLVEGAQHQTAFAKVNPSQGVPVLVTGQGQHLTQSLAILEWLEEVYPDPALLPPEPDQRARQRAAAMAIACDIHPVNNRRVRLYLKGLGHGDAEVMDWLRHWMEQGLAAFQDLIQHDARFCFGAHPGFADICLIPQLYNARLCKMDLSPYGRLLAVEEACNALAPFQAAHPRQQPDAP